MIPLTIASIDRVIFSGNAASVNCPATEGEVTILPNHIPFITRLKSGIVSVSLGDGQIKKFPIEKGLLAVHKKEAVILL
jgi:F-type H+-transporting ATPase subunit epsilon